MSVQFTRLCRSLLALLIGLLLVACGTAPNESSSSAAADVVTTGCPEAKPLLQASLVVAAANNLMAVEPNGGRQTQLLTLALDASAAFPAWSPDGKTLAYALRYPVSIGEQQRLTSVICGIDQATGEGRLLAEGTKNDWLDQPAWSSDGRALLVTLRRLQSSPGATNIARYELATGELKVLISKAHSPAFSPDGTRLAYVGVDEETQAEALYVANLDGTEPQLIKRMEDGLVTATGPRWSEDGSRLLFSASLSTESDGDRYAVFVIGSDGQDLQQISKSAHNFISVEWAPGNDRIAFVIGGVGLFVRNMGDDQEQKLTRAGDGMGLSWSRR